MSYSNNPLSIIGGVGITVTPSTGSGAQTVTITATGRETVPVTIVTETPYNVLSTDYMLSVVLDEPGPVSVILPIAPTGTVYYVKDGSGLASSTQPITITADGPTNIDGAASAVINTDYGSLTFVFVGTQWEIV